MAFRSALLCTALVVTLALCLPHASLGVLPGFKTALTARGLAYARTQGLAYLQQQLRSRTVTVPDQSGEKDTIEWSITNIVISGITIPDGNAAFIPGTGITISTSDCSATITANWHGREKIWPHPSGSGTATINLSNVMLAVNIQITEVNGKPHLNAVGTGVNIGNLDIHFSGSNLDFLLNLLKGLFEGKIKSAAESALSNAITQEVDQGLNQLLQSLPTVVSISSIAEIDYSLVSNELFTASYMTLDAKGEFYQVGHVVEAPYTPTALPDMESGNQMVQFVFSEYVPNTALYVYWAAGAISLQITPSMIPSDSPIQFNTSDWKTIVPALAAKYPGWAMKAMVSATAPPVVSFSASDISGVASSPIRMYVVNPSTGASIPVFTIGMNNTLSATVGINGNKVVGAITGYKPTIWLASSQIGNFDPTTLEQLLTFLMEGVLLPYANQYLKTGFPIPTVDGVALVNPTMGYGNHLVYIESDISYTPPASSGLTPI